MSDAFAEYISKYVKEHAPQFKQYILAALNSESHSLSYVESTNGVVNQSADLRNCEFLVDAHIFQESFRFSRNGRIFYKVFSLTELGEKLAEELQKKNVIVHEEPP